MRFRTTITSYATAAALLSLTACGNDPLGVNSGDQLSSLEIQSVFNAMWAAFSSGGVASSPAGAPGVGLVPIPINQSFTFSADCPLGGSIGIDGSANGQIDDQTLEGNLSMTFTYTLNECAVTANDITVTVSHNPEIVFEGGFTYSQDLLTVDGTERGGFEYVASDGRQGSCAIDLSFSVSYNSGTQTSTASVTGEVCGLSVDQFNPVNTGTG